MPGGVEYLLGPRAYILPKDPVARKRASGSKRGPAEISDITAEVSGFGDKPGIGKTGVHLRWYDDEEYKKLNRDQKRELNQWRTSKRQSYPNFDSKGDGKGNESTTSKRKQKREKKAIAAQI